MSFSLSPTLANSSDLVAGFSMQSGDLLALDGFNPDDEHTKRAVRTSALWRAAQDLDDVAMMLVRDGVRLSVGSRAGGVIVEGKHKLNVGLLRGSLRSEAPVVPDFPEFDELHFGSAVRDGLWAALSRIGTSVIPRSLQFHLTGVTGVITVRDGRMRFAGDFVNAHDFAGEVRAASEIMEPIEYTLIDLQDLDDGPTYSIVDLLIAHGETEVGDSWSFDQTGWPTMCPADADFTTLRTFVRMARALGDWGGEDAGACSCVLLTSTNSQRANLKRDQDHQTVISLE